MADRWNVHRRDVPRCGGQVGYVWTTLDFRWDLPPAATPSVAPPPPPFYVTCLILKAFEVMAPGMDYLQEKKLTLLLLEMQVLQTMNKIII